MIANQQEKWEGQMKDMTLSIIKSFAKAIDARDTVTGKHSKNVAELMVDFAKHLGSSQQVTYLAYLAGMAHDIGKIGIPDEILNKPAKLENHEFDFIKRHPDIGADILSEIDEFKAIIPAVRYHHEWYDGTGYSQGLQGLTIPLLSRMLSLCDSYDAMTTARCYRKTLTPTQACEQIELSRGTQFDPELSKIFIAFILQSQINNLLP
jgi:putative nucleotidyltransferase with HDIG domain